MKKIIFTMAALLAFVFSGVTQTNTFPSTGSAGIGTASPVASSLLEMKSTTKGLLISRMTKTQRDAIISPASGLLIYQTNSTPGFYYYDGSAWQALTPKTANRTLSNLTAPTEINESLLAATGNMIDLGSSTKGWKNIYLDSALYVKGSKVLYCSGNNIFLGRYSGNITGSGSNNTGIGDNVFSKITFGLSNTGIGTHALSYNTTGSFNTAVGSQALSRNTAGGGNTASGLSSLSENTAGNLNTANGFIALSNNETGSSNTGIGANALYWNTTGNSNIAIGVSSLLNNTTRSNLVAIGDSALYNNGIGASTPYQASRNTAVGSKALFSNTVAFQNTAVGMLSLYSNTTGDNNTASGALSLYSNTTGDFNTAGGTLALNFNTTGSYNTANGASALNNNSEGVYNTANGYFSLFTNTTGYNNTASGVNALLYNTYGNSNTADGVNALLTNTTGSGNTAIGLQADVTAGNFNNATVIGYNATVDAPNKVRIGNTSVTSIGGQVAWTTFSDGRYKKDIKEDVQGLTFINSLRPITYTINVKGLNEYYNKGRKQVAENKDEKLAVEIATSEEAAGNIVYNGFIAQEVEKAAKKLKYEFSGVDKPQTEDGIYGLRYDNFIAPLVKAVQELSIENDKLKNQNSAQQKINQDLQKQIDELKASINFNSSGSKQLNTISSASIEQNIPNPFSNTTIINYTLPLKYSSAKIIVADKTGKVLKEINISSYGKGSLNVDASILASGAYQYSLIVDGRLIDTKQMVLTK